MMDCPKCGEWCDVVDSRLHEGGAMRQRRRQCTGCGYRFNTEERFDPRHALSGRSRANHRSSLKLVQALIHEA